MIRPMEIGCVGLVGCIRGDGGHPESLESPLHPKKGLSTLAVTWSPKSTDSVQLSQSGRRYSEWRTTVMRRPISASPKDTEGERERGEEEGRRGGGGPTFFSPSKIGRLFSRSPPSGVDAVVNLPLEGSSNKDSVCGLLLSTPPMQVPGAIGGEAARRQTRSCSTLSAKPNWPALKCSGKRQHSVFNDWNTVLPHQREESVSCSKERKKKRRKKILKAG